MEPAIERFAAISFFVVGLSHVLQPKGWAEYFAQLRARGAPGAFINGMMSLSMGALIVAFHGGDWSWPGGIVTFIGWGQVFKGTLHMCVPSHSLRSMAQVPVEKAWKFVAAGAVMLPLSVAMFVASLR
jgi:hypothetical protein